MAETTISQLRVNGETRDIADSWARQQLDSSGDHGHKIMDESGVIYPNRRKLKFINADVSDDAENDTTIVDINVTRFIEKPTVTVDDYEYDGTEQGPTIVGLTDDMVVRDAKKIDPGNYELVISLKNKRAMIWADKTNADLVYEYTINKNVVNIPDVEGNYTYDGTQKEVVITGLDTDKVSMTGTVTGTNAGTYLINLELKNQSTSVWSDGTSSIKTKKWVINKCETTFIWQYYRDADEGWVNAGNYMTLGESTRLYYDIRVLTNGENRNINIISNDPEALTVEHQEDNYFRIKVADGFDTISHTSITITIYENENYTSYIIDKAINVELISSELDLCSWEDIKKVSDSGRASSVWGVGTGSDTRKKIKLNGNVGNYCTLNNVEVYVFILEHNHNAEVEGYGITFGTFLIKDGQYLRYVALHDSLTFNSDGTDKSQSEKVYYQGEKCFNMNHWGTSVSRGVSSPNYGGWAACDLRYDILGSTDRAPSGYGSKKTTSSVGYDATSTCATNPVPNTLMAALPADLRAVMKPITKYTNNSGLRSAPDELLSDVTATIDYLPLLSAYETSGDNFVGLSGQWYPKQEIYKTVQYDYYKNGNITSSTYKPLQYPSVNNSISFLVRTPYLYPKDEPNAYDGAWMLFQWSCNTCVTYPISPIFLV